MMASNAILTMIGIYCIILIPFLVAWLFVRRHNRKLDEEHQELLNNQLYTRCSCGFSELWDKREKTITECPDCGAEAFGP